MSNYTAQDLQEQLKPLSDNAFLRFFQKIWRWWLGVWYGFADKHPKASGIIYMVFFFIVFSEGVTIFQFLVMTFLPFAFQSLASVPFVWPAVNIGDLTYTSNGVETPLQYAIFNEPVVYVDGAVSANGGLGNFLAYEIAVFLAQCINFPLQRNITYRSHGNPWYQAMWYFIGWVLVSIGVNAIWGILVPFMRDYWAWPYALWNLIKTILTGGVSMVIFFFIFLIIFPDNNKVAKNAKAKYDKLVASGAPSEKIAKAEAKYNIAARKAELSNAEKEASQAKSQLNSKAMRYFSLVNVAEKAENEEQKKEYTEKVDAAFNEAVAALETKIEKEAAFADVKAKGAAA